MLNVCRDTWASIHTLTTIAVAEQFVGETKVGDILCMCSHTELRRHARKHRLLYIHRKFSLLFSFLSSAQPLPFPISFKIFPSPNLFLYSLSPLIYPLSSTSPTVSLSLSDLAICPVTLPSLAGGPSPCSVTTCHHPLSSPLSLTFHLSHPHLTPSSLGLSQGERQSYAGLEAGLDRRIGWMGGLEKD